MKFSFLPRAIACCFSVAALLAASAASAQYIWLNEKGVKQYSDMPPPASVPSNKILKQPGGHALSSDASASSVTSEQQAEDEKGIASEKAKQALTTAEKNAEFQKRQMERAEKEKKAAEQRQQELEKKKNCERAQAYQRSLDSGERLARTDRNGERYYLNDQQRSQEIRENRRFLDTCK